MNEATRTRAVADTNYLYAHAAEVNAGGESPRTWVRRISARFPPAEFAAGAAHAPARFPPRAHPRINPIKFGTVLRRAAEALQTLEDRLTFFPEIDPEDECVSEEGRAHLARIIEGLDAIRNSGYVPLHTVADTVRYIADLLER